MDDGVPKVYHYSDGYWLCEQPRNWESLCQLPLIAHHRDRWAGVVLVRPQPRNLAAALERIEDWTDASLLGRHFLILGDAELVLRIRQALDSAG